ncbi:hypothetical protein [Stenotrophomonas lacuserhaii]|uniref:hypothetical protein n=1 Tax=Stenotrophomonas lacuserhaii TaxID=2760084 RepID=UPI0015FD3FA0|nr:hypothetical protein [Stenotrophomonas lacuserhaii]
MRWKAAAVALACVIASGAVAWRLHHEEPSSRTPSLNAAESPPTKGVPEPPHEMPAVNGPTPVAESRATAFWRSQQSADLSALQWQADQGNAIAQRELGQAYQRCFPALASPADDYLRSARSMAANLSTAEERALLVGAAQFRLQQCQSMDGGQRVPAEAAALWLDAAAARGDVPAQAMAAFRSSDEGRPERIAAAWERALRAADGRALHALLGSEDSAGFTRRLGAVVKPNDALAVMSVVACRMGAACQPGGEVMLELCLNAFHCSDRSFEELIFEPGELGDRELAIRAQIDSVVRVIVRMQALD